MQVTSHTYFNGLSHCCMNAKRMTVSMPLGVPYVNIACLHACANPKGYHYTALRTSTFMVHHTHTHTHTYTLVSLSNTDIEVNLCILKPTADIRYNRLFSYPFLAMKQRKIVQGQRKVPLNFTKNLPAQLINCLQSGCL